jgi:hypothetical protein
MDPLSSISNSCFSVSEFLSAELTSLGWTSSDPIWQKISSQHKLSAQQSTYIVILIQYKKYNRVL